MATSSSTPEYEQIDDPSEYNQRRRLSAIQDARERVMEQRRQALELETYGQIREDLGQTIVREAVEDYVMEVEQLVRRAEDRLTPEESEHDTAWYWEEANLGAVYLPDKGGEYPIHGLQAFLDFPSPYKAEWYEEAEPPAGFTKHPEADSEGVVHRSAAVQLPKSVSMNAYRVVNRFLAASGLDANPEKTLPEYGFRELEDYEIEELEAAGVTVDHG